MIEFGGEYPRGGVIRLAIDFSATDGETLADIDLIEADLRAAGFKPSIITEDMPLVGSFTVEERDDNAGWLLTFADTNALALGWYAVDLRMVIGGEPQISPPACLEITEAVTRRPA